MTEYDDALREKELEERIPSEAELEDVAVLVSFPSVRASDDESKAYETFMLRAKICTMALEGLTPEKAEQVAEARGGTTGDAGAAGAAGSATPGSTGGNK